MTDRVLAAAVLALLAASAGCSAIGGGGISQEQLAEDADYDWTTTANATITIERGKSTYEAVYRIDGQDTLAFYRFQEFSNDRPLEVSAVYFRYPNGTEVTLGTDAVEIAQSRTVITPPAETGRLALSAPKRGKHIVVAAVVEGPYEVILPPEADVRYPLFARVIPRNYERTVRDGRVHLTWDEVRGDRLVVRYYLASDLLLFGGLAAAGAIVAAGGLVYFWLQLRTLRRRREEVAWDGES